MTSIINPFDAGGYSLAEMTEAINILPNVYTRLGEMGLFRFEGVTRRSVIIEQLDGVLNLLPTVPLGGPPTVANRDIRSMRSFSIPWIPHDDVITPQDIQGVRGFGSGDSADPLVTLMERKLTRMRTKHAQTREYMEINALRGVVKDGAGQTLYNYFSEFGLTQLAVDFVLGTAGTNVQAKCREVLRHVETELKGEIMTNVLALVSPGFFDKLIGHAKVEEAYKYFSTTGAQPLREDVRRRFPFAGVVFEEYAGNRIAPRGHEEVRVRRFYQVTTTEYYWDRVVTEYTVAGATIAQTFLNAQAGWFLGPTVYFTDPAASGDVHAVVCECTAGAPDLEKALCKVTVTAANLKKYPTETRFPMPPIFLEAGKRYAVVFTSSGAHKLAMADKNRYAAGTLMRATDGAAFEPIDVADKDLLLELPFARFSASRVEVELAAQSLSGGMSDIDLLFEAIKPGGCELQFFYQPQASTDWYPIDDPQGTTPLNALPPLVRLKAVFVGSPDVMPGFALTGSRIMTYRLKTAFKHVSVLQTLGAASDEIKVTAYLEGFDPAHHTATVKLQIGATTEVHDSVVDEVVPPYGGSPGGIRRTATFNLPAPQTDFRIWLEGTTDSALLPFHVNERVYYAF